MENEGRTVVFSPAMQNHIFLIGKVSFVSQSGQVFLLFWQIWSLYCSAEMTDNPFIKLETTPPDHLAYYLKKNTTQHGAYHCIQKRKSRPVCQSPVLCVQLGGWRQCENSLFLSGNRVLYQIAAIGIQRQWQNCLGMTESRMTLFKGEGMHSPRK